MNAPINIPRNERGIVRVFALSLDPVAAQALKVSADAIKKTLGADIALDTTHVEIFPVRDLHEIGLVGYLMEGDAVTADQLAPDRAKLEKLSGWVLIVYSLAFGDRSTTLKPDKALTLIGTYGETRTDWSSTRDVESDAAKPVSDQPTRPSDAAILGRIAMLALIVLGLLTALMVWIA